MKSLEISDQGGCAFIWRAGQGVSQVSHPVATVSHRYRHQTPPMDRPDAPRRPRELSFYKKSRDADRERDTDRDRDRRGRETNGATGSFTSRRDPLERLPRGGRDRSPAARERSPEPHRRDPVAGRVRRAREETDDEELERRRREYRGGAPLERVRTREEVRERGGVAYRGGEELRRVETRVEKR